jgi:hypothetical protein
MNADFEGSDEEQRQPEDEEIDWQRYAQREEQGVLRPLDGKDYIALFIASCQTIFLPLIVLIVVMLVINFWLQIAVG